jgi:hypothetical protein
VGRDEEENGRLSGFVAEDDVVMEQVSEPGPLVVVRGDPESADLELARKITACYTAGDGARVKIETRAAGSVEMSHAVASARQATDRLRIGALEPGWRRSVDIPIVPQVVATG